MGNPEVTSGFTSEELLDQNADAVMHSVGVLDALSEHLSDENTSGEIEPELVGTWITVIAKAILAIFKT